MSRKANLVALGVVSLMLSLPASANAAGCKLNGTKLDCTVDGSSQEDIVKSFSSMETREALATPLSEVSRFQENGSVEAYRRSMEANWRTVTRLSRAMERDRRTGRMSAEDFGIWQKQFEEAKKSYETAIRFYRYLHWQGLK